MVSVDQQLANFERNIGQVTGRPFEDWIALVRAQQLARHGEMVTWLKTEHLLSHGHANHIAKRTLEAAAPRSANDQVAHLFQGGKEGLRPLYDALADASVALGADVEIAPKKANVSVRRRKQFALIQPTTRTRLDLGLILKDHPVGGRLEASGSFNAMFTHRVKIAALSEVDDEIRSWLRQAYDGAARALS